MPIIFQDLESILFDWKTQLKMKKPEERTGKFVYKHMIKLQKERVLKKISNLFDSISCDDIEIKEEINPDRTYGKLQKERQIFVNKKNSKL